LFRGGRVDVLTAREDLAGSQTILNLRRGRDPEVRGTRELHIPASNTLDNYRTAERPVRRWLNEALRALADDETAWPVYVHCTAGRDRTGVLVAAVLHRIGVPEQVIVEEYALSDNADEALIVEALRGMGDMSWCSTTPSHLRRILGPAGSSSAPSFSGPS